MVKDFNFGDLVTQLNQHYYLSKLTESSDLVEDLVTEENASEYFNVGIVLWALNNTDLAHQILKQVEIVAKDCKNIILFYQI